MPTKFQEPALEFIFDEYFDLDNPKALVEKLKTETQPIQIISKKFPEHTKLYIDPKTWRLSSTVLEADPRTISIVFIGNERISQVRSCWEHPLTKG